MNYKKIKIEEFDKLQRLSPKQVNWEKYKDQQLYRFENKELDIFVIEDNNTFVGELTINYVSQTLKSETIPNQRVYLEAFRIDKDYQGKGLGQKLIEYCISFLSEIGYSEFTIGVEDDNEIAKHIYFKNGFTEAIDKGNGNEFDHCKYTLYLKSIYKDILSRVMLECNLGKVIENPIKVNGGLSHKMYKVKTNKGTYAVKELNSGIMKREEAYNNFVFSEKVTDIAKENGVSAIGALNIDNDIMKLVDGKYYMIFEWLDGKVLNPNEITIEHCKKIGNILAKIHNLDFSLLMSDNISKETYKMFDWEFYIQKAQENNKKYVKLLLENKTTLEEINLKSIDAMTIADKNMIISHRDLDRKNVMWKNNIPFIIDWEASGYVNPIIEVISTAYYWCGGETEELDEIKFRSFLIEYKKVSKIKIDENIEKFVYADFYSGLNWLEYNLRRSMCIENEYDNDEILLAENEVIKVINDIKYNISQLDTIINIMKK